MRVLIGLVVLTLCAHGQAGKTGSLSGVVVNAATGEPVKRALVRIIGAEPVEPRETSETAEAIQPKIINRSTMSDESGVFRFDGVPAISYSINAQKPQFSSSFDTKAATAPADNIRVSLEPLGVITGRVVDENGNPVRIANVYAIHSSVQDGTRIFTRARSVTTDDRGMYRLWNLASGKYLIKAFGFAASTVTYNGDSAATTGTEAYPPTWYGGGQTRDTATAVEMRAGREERADLTLHIGPGYVLRGRLAGITSRSQVTFELVSDSGDASPVRANLNNNTGDFSVLGVIPGVTTLRVTQDNAIGEQRLDVPAADVSGIALTLQQPVAIPYNITLTESDAASNPNPRRFRGSCAPKLRSLGASLSRNYGIGGRQNALGPIPPGRYRVDIGCAGAYVRSATFGSQDLLTNPDITILPGPQQSIEILAGHTDTQVTGQIKELQEAKELGAPLVLLVHTATGRSTPIVTSPEGQFFSSGLAPGDYVAYAFSSSDDVEFRNPEFVRALSGGVPVRIEDGKNAEIVIPGVIK